MPPSLSWHSFSRISDWKQRSVSRETREYDLRRDSFKRIEKQRPGTSRMTVQKRSRREDEETMTRGKAGLMKNSAHSWQARCWSKNHWIDLSLNRSNHRGRLAFRQGWNLINMAKHNGCILPLVITYCDSFLIVVLFLEYTSFVDNQLWSWILRIHFLNLYFKFVKLNS